MIINNESVKHQILTALSDEYSRQILTATSNQPTSALEVSTTFNIPLTTVYRRIQGLIDAGLITAVKSGRTTDGKWYDLYRNLLPRIDVRFDSGEVRVDAKVDDHLSERFTRIWN